MEVALEVEDDVFFADLSKQISLLIMDDEDHQIPVAHIPAASLEAWSQVIRPPTNEQPFLLRQEERCRRECKGTGVFIPRSSYPRRTMKNKQGRFATVNSNTAKVQSSRQIHQYSSSYHDAASTGLHPHHHLLHNYNNYTYNNPVYHDSSFESSTTRH